MFGNGNFGTKLGSDVNFKSTPPTITFRAGDSGPELTTCTEVYYADFVFPVQFGSFPVKVASGKVKA